MNKTPLQKSIAEIEVQIATLTEELKFTNMGQVYKLKLMEQREGFSQSIKILTANLEYERGVIEDAYRQGETDYILENVDGTGCDYESAHDYYTKTYKHDRDKTES